MSLKSELQVASTLIEHLEMLSSTGYEMMGVHSQFFLKDIARTGCISDENLSLYLDDFDSAVERVSWFLENSKTNALNFAKTVREYLNDRTAENAENILAF